MRNHGRSTVIAIAAKQVAHTRTGLFIWLLNVLLMSPLTNIRESFSAGSLIYSRTSTSQRNLTFDASRRQNRCPLSRLSKLHIGSGGTENIYSEIKIYLLSGKNSIDDDGFKETKKKTIFVNGFRGILVETKAKQIFKIN